MKYFITCEVTIRRNSTRAVKSYPAGHRSAWTAATGEVQEQPVVELEQFGSGFSPPHQYSKAAIAVVFSRRSGVN